MPSPISRDEVALSGRIRELVRTIPATPVTAFVLAACIGVFITLHVTGKPTTSGDWAQWGVATIDRVHAGQWWVLWTSCFVHVAVWHLAFNMWALWSIGRPLERAIGPARYLTISLICAAISSAAQLTSTGSIGIGYSGVLFGLIGAGWFVRGRFTELASVFTRSNLIWWGAWLIGCWVLTLKGVVNIGNWAHLAGLATGAALGLVLMRRRALGVAALVVLIAGVGTAQVWRPWSVTWTVERAWSAHKRGDLAAAERGYRRSLELGQDPRWVHEHLAQALLADGDRAGFEHELELLRSLNPGRANELAQCAQDRQWFVAQLASQLSDEERELRQAQLDLADWKLDLATSGLKRVLLRSPKDLAAQGNLALCSALDRSASDRDLERALQTLEAAMSSTESADPTAAAARDLLRRRLGRDVDTNDAVDSAAR